MADANLYDDTSLPAEKKADTKENSGKLFSMFFTGKWRGRLRLLVYGVIFCSFYFTLSGSEMRAESLIGYIISVASLSLLGYLTFLIFLFALFGDRIRQAKQ